MQSLFKVASIAAALLGAQVPAFAKDVSNAPSLIALNAEIKALPLTRDTDATDLNSENPGFDVTTLDFNTPAATLAGYEGMCNDLNWKSATYTAMLSRMPNDIELWNGKLERLDGHQYLLQNRLQKRLKADYKTYGEELCRAIYNEYGPGGKLGKHLANFVNYYSAESRYGKQIVFRARDLCRNTDNFTTPKRSGSVFLNSFWSFYKWYSTFIMPPPGLVTSIRL